ncbi:protein-L-isoaspartate O-methyltransferase family protein [Actinomadura terrae]|uniref:protein-L-isoaspartate O-methyltransferase family protein n=1 Tax=Actinomadura terrae TaxID=604353 RepID=UPI001FA7DEB8|nr:methyltransferase domain-containing protein [Actinomadura terrae]
MTEKAITFPDLPPVDRRPFIPDDIWIVENDAWARLSRREDPLKWESLVASDEAVITEIKDGIWPVSSSSAPGVMANMISSLRLAPGTRVLEIGTGTGWNAACLAALGAEVVSVEIDTDIAARARTNLRKAGHPEVTVVTGDGEQGAAEYAPFDRILSTAAARIVPYCWVEQCTEGGLIVTPYTGEAHKWALLVLTVSAGVASGGLEGTASFMPLRGQGLSPVNREAIENHDDLRIEVSRSGQTLTYSRD